MRPGAPALPRTEPAPPLLGDRSRLARGSLQQGRGRPGTLRPPGPGRTRPQSHRDQAGSLGSNLPLRLMRGEKSQSHSRSNLLLACSDTAGNIGDSRHCQWGRRFHYTISEWHHPNKGGLGKLHQVFPLRPLATLYYFYKALEQAADDISCFF